MFSDKVILVVDDARTEHQTIRAYLEHELSGCELLGASGIKALTQVLAERTPDLAVVLVPLAWAQLSDVLKVMAFKADCPIIFVPDIERVSAVAQVMRQGMDDCIIRPAVKVAENSDSTFLKLLGFAVFRVMYWSQTRSSDEELLEKLAHKNHVDQVYLMGTLTSTVAHDFNNLLTIIHGYSHLAIQELLDEENIEKVVQYLEKIEEKTVLGGSLINKIMQFAHKPHAEAIVLPLNRVVDDMKDMLRGMVGEGIELVVDLPADDVPIRIDPKALELVLMNLVDNACDAMHGQGTLTIQIAQRELDQQEAAALGIDANTYAMLSITDTGVGMDASMTANIFNAFFTTKELGVGTGLGLASVYSCVRDHGGVIFVRSVPGDGATFEILWPRHDSHVEEGARGVAP